MRKLASFRKVIDIKPIQGADLIELASIDGWNVVVKRGEFKVGDIGVYFEIDSLLPLRPEFEFLNKSSIKESSDSTDSKEIYKGYLLKTKKLRGQVSQGLLLNPSLFDELKDIKLVEGFDLTDILGIRKYERPLPKEMYTRAKGSIPSYIEKTDEERIQNLYSCYEELKTKSYYLTEKLDGSSITIYKFEGKIGVCSRNIELLENDRDRYWDTVKSLDIISKLKNLPLDNIAIQGELLGEGINKNKYALHSNDIYFFTLFDISTSKKLHKKVLERVIFSMGLNIVPIIEENYKLPDTLEELLLLAEGSSILNPLTNREGLVIRTYDNQTSFKVISNKYLLKH